MTPPAARPGNAAASPAALQSVLIGCPHCGREQELTCAGIGADSLVRCSSCGEILATWAVIIDVSEREPSNVRPSH